MRNNHVLSLNPKGRKETITLVVVFLGVLLISAFAVYFLASKSAEQRREGAATTQIDNTSFRSRGNVSESFSGADSATGENRLIWDGGLQRGQHPADDQERGLALDPDRPSGHAGSDRIAAHHGTVAEHRAVLRDGGGRRAVCRRLSPQILVDRADAVVGRGNCRAVAAPRCRPSSKFP